MIPVCLAITKGVAASSLGLYAGILTGATVLCRETATSVIIASLDVVTQANVNKLVDRFCHVTTVLGTLATGFFAMSYFIPTDHWRHPYLIYGMLTTPLTSLYLFAMKNRYKKKSILQNGGSNDTSTITMNDLDDSVVDLKTDKTALQIDQVAITRNVAAKCNNITKHLAAASIVSILGFAQSVVGMYGEGYI